MTFSFFGFIISIMSSLSVLKRHLFSRLCWTCHWNRTQCCKLKIIRPVKGSGLDMMHDLWKGQCQKMPFSYPEGRRKCGGVIVVASEFPLDGRKIEGSGGGWRLLCIFRQETLLNIISLLHSVHRQLSHPPPPPPFPSSMLFGRWEKACVIVHHWRQHWERGRGK